MSAFDDAAAALAADPHLSRPAIYYAAGAGAGKAIRVIFSEPARIDAVAQADKVARDIQADVLLADTPDVARDDRLVIGDTHYSVANVIQDDLKISATLLLRVASKSGV